MAKNKGIIYLYPNYDEPMNPRLNQWANIAGEEPMHDQPALSLWILYWAVYPTQKCRPLNPDSSCWEQSEKMVVSVSNKLL